MLQRLNENKDLIIVAIASFFIGFGAASLFGEDMTEKTTDVTLPPLPFNEERVEKNLEPRAGDVTVISGTNSLLVENQRAGSSVEVQKGEFPEARWVVVRDMNDDGTLGNILGASWFPAGMHQNISVQLVRGTMGGEQYAAMLFADSNGDKKFDHKMDEPVKDSSGNIISAMFRTVATPGEE